jgi:DNA primase
LSRGNHIFFNNPLFQPGKKLFSQPDKLIILLPNMSASHSLSPVQVDLVRIVSKYVLLEESRRNLKGRCPFHKDQATSLMVSPEKNIFQCFGCGKGGGPVEFVMAIEHKTREEAIQMIAGTN